MSDDEWDTYFRRRGRPFFGSWFFADIDEAFREMEEIWEKEYSELTEKIPKDLVCEKTMPDGTKTREWGPFVYGYSITIGPDGKPQIREFGNIKFEMGHGAGRRRIGIKEEREPLVDVVSANGEVKVIAEMSGVEKNDIKIHGTEDTLTILADSHQRKYYKEIGLPAEVDPRRGRSSYKNGVLEVTIPKKKEEKPKGEPINIE